MGHGFPASTRRALLSTRLQRPRTPLGRISAFGDWMVAHILSLRISRESRSLHRLVEYLSRIAVYQSENIGNNPKVSYGRNKFATIYSLSCRVQARCGAAHFSPKIFTREPLMSHISIDMPKKRKPSKPSLNEAQAQFRKQL